MTALHAAAPPRRPARAPGLLACLLLVALVHAWLLGGLPLGVGDAARGGTPHALQVRQIVRAAATAAQPEQAAGPPVPAAQERVRAATPPPLPELTSPTPAAAAPATADAEPDAEPQALEPGGGSTPTYPTRLPAPAVLQYELRRGALLGHAQLNWQPAVQGYEMTLEWSFLGRRQAQWSSRGGFDAAGIAPERFLAQRGREQRAANFQRERGRISFSGPRTEYPLVPGAQDRLSVLAQLAAIVAADSRRSDVGAQVSLLVVGARGDGDVWTFTVLDRDELELPAGPVQRPVHLRREPSRPYDTTVDVWLDPARGHLPVRFRLSVGASGESNDFVLSGAGT